MKPYPVRPANPVAKCHKHNWLLSRAQIKKRECMNDKTKRLKRRHKGKPCRWLQLFETEVNNATDKTAGENQI